MYMKLLRTVTVLNVLYLCLFSACSFNYGLTDGAGAPVPDMVFQNVSVDRYENAALSVSFTAKNLEMYSDDRVWAAENCTFVQYKSGDPQTIEAEGSAGMLLVDDSQQVYSLGDTVRFHLISDNLTFNAPDLRWAKKIQRLSGPRDGEVDITKDDGTVVRGTGFFADTASRSYQFRKSVSGQLVNGASPDVGVKNAAVTPGGA
jgi:hypothetical protein